MATPSLKGYATSQQALIGDENAIQKQREETPGYNMFNTGTTSATTTQNLTDLGKLAKDKEVEAGLGISLVSPMSDVEKQDYLNNLSNEQYRQMKKYKNEGYSFEASRTLLENSSGLKNPTALGTDKYQPKGKFFTNTTAGVLDSVTGLPRMIGNWGGDLVGWIAKKLGADEDKVNYLVQDWKNYISSEQLAKEMGANKDSGTYKIAKGVGDITQTIAGEKLIGNALQGTARGAKLLSKAEQIKNANLLGKMGVNALEGAADMGLYNMVSESELPSGKDLAFGAAIGAAAPVVGVGLKATGKAIKGAAAPVVGVGLKATGKAIKGAATSGAEKLIKGMNKLSKGKQTKFMQMVSEDYGKWMNDRGIKSGEELVDYFLKSKNKVDEAMATIQGRFTDSSLTKVLDDTVEFAGKTQDKQLERLLELQRKNAEGGLTMQEINEVKRYFEQNNKFTYLGGSDSIKAKEATNMDTALREWQQKVASENGLTNLAELNKETQASKYLVNNTYDRSSMAVSDRIPLTDILTVMVGKNPTQGLTALLGKKTLEAPRFKNKLVDVLNWFGRHQTIPEKLADLEAISKINNEKELNALLKKRESERPALPYNQNVENVNTIMKGGETIIGTPEGQSIIKDSITEIK